MPTTAKEATNYRLPCHDRFLRYYSSVGLTFIHYTYYLARLITAQRYAQWSQRLNVEIYVAYGEANGHATEALSNVRTVKAMSTELQGTRDTIIIRVGRFRSWYSGAGYDV